VTGRTPMTLDEMELDALTELVNLGVGNAALGLREMVQEEVLLTVPNVSIVTREQAIANLGPRGTRRLVAVHQNFDGDIRGRALLIFPEAQSMELVRAVVGGDLSLEDIMELEQEALAETGNVLLNGCLGTIANSFQRNLRISLPEVVYGDGSEFFNLTAQPHADDSVLFIYINFAVRRRDIQGYLAMLLDLPSLVTLKELLAEFIQRMGGPAPASPANAS
jgi:chemotaxis protein CheC